MSVFSSIMSKIFGGDEAAAKPDAQPASSTASASSAQASASPMNTSAAPSATSQQLSMWRLYSPAWHRRTRSSSTRAPQLSI